MFEEDIIITDVNDECQIGNVNYVKEIRSISLSKYEIKLFYIDYD